jgi:hypothetical protein
MVYGRQDFMQLSGMLLLRALRMHTSFSQSFSARNQSEAFAWASIMQLLIEHATRASKFFVVRATPGLDHLGARLVTGSRFSSLSSSIGFFFLAAINPCHFAFDRKYVHCVVGGEEEAEEAMARKKKTR